MRESFSNRERERWNQSQTGGVGDSDRADRPVLRYIAAVREDAFKAG